MKIKTEIRNTILKIYFSLYILFCLFDEKRVIVKMKKKREKMEEKKEKKRVRGKIRNLSRKEVVLVTRIRMTLLQRKETREGCIDLGQNSRIHVKNFPNK